MSKKKLRNRLESLFADLEQEATVSPDSASQPLPGWTWECDEDGCYTACSPEVKIVLGYESSEFVGQPLAGFALHPLSASVLAEKLAEGLFPLEISLQFYSAEGDLITTTFHAFSTDGEKDGQNRLRGFVQVTQAGQGTAEAFLSPTPSDSSRIVEPQIHSEGPLLAPKEWITPAKAPRTPLGKESLLRGQLQISNGSPRTPASVAIPVPLEDHNLGLLELVDDNPERLWSADERRLVEQVSDQLLLALENARLFQNEQRRASELNTLVELSRLISQNLELEEVYVTAHHIIGQLMPTESFFINLVDNNTNEFVEVYIVDKGVRFPVDRFPLDVGFSGHVFRTGEPYLARDINIETTPFPQMITPGSGEGVNSVLAVPLRFSDQIIGVLSTQSYTPKAYSQNDLQLLQTFADHIAIAIQNAQMFEQTQAALRETETLYSISSIASRSFKIEETIQELLEKVLEAINFDVGMISLLDEDSGKLALAAHHGLPESLQTKLQTDGFENTLCGLVFLERRSISLDDISADAPLDVSELVQLGYRSYLGVPLISKDRVLGTLCSFSSDANINQRAHLSLLEAASLQIAIAVENTHLFQQTEARAEELGILHAVSLELAQEQRDLNSVLEIITHRAMELLEADGGGVWLWREEEKELELVITFQPSGNEMTGRRLAPGSGLVGRAFVEGKVQHLDDYLNWEQVPDTFADAQFKGAIAAPLVWQSSVVGVLAVTRTQSNLPFAPADYSLAELLAGQASAVIQNARLYQEEQHRRQVADTLREIARVVSSSLDIHEVSERMLSQLANLIPYQTASIQLVQGGKRQLIGGRGFAVSTAADQESNLWRPITDDPLILEVVESRQPLLIADTHQDARWVILPATAHVRSWISAPLIVGQEVVGILTLDHDKPNTYTADTAEVATAVAAQAAIAIQNARLFERSQETLAETEALYEASAELNAVQTYDEILAILRKSTVLGKKGVCNVSINLFDRPWIGTDVPDTSMPIARWSFSPFTEIPGTRYQLSSWANVDEVLNSNTVTLISNLAHDPRLDASAKALYVDRLNAKSLLYAPVNAGGQWWGYITAVYLEPIVVTDVETRRLMALSSQAGVAIHNLRLLEESRRRAAQLETAAEIARDTSATLALDTLLRRAVNLIRDRYGYYHSSIFLIDETGMSAVIRESTGEAGEEMKRRGHKLPVGSRSIIGYVCELGKPLVISDVTQDPIHRPNPLLPETRSELGIPLKIGNRVIGAIDVQASDKNSFTPDDIAIIQTLADQIAVAVDNARSYELAQQAIEENRRRVQELSVLFNVSQALASAPLDQVEIANTVAQEFIEVMNVPECAISIYEPEEERLVILADLSLPRDDRLGTQLYRTDRSGTSYMVEELPMMIDVMSTMQHRILQASDPEIDPAEFAYMEKSGISTLLIIPLSIKGESIGVVELKAWDRERSFTSDHINLAVTVANAAAVAMDNARLYEEQRRITEKLREVDKLKSQFLANMSHELRTPLNSIIGFSRVILKGIDGPITDLQQQDLSAIFNAGQHLLNLINDILDISKIEAGKMELAFDDNISLAEMINSAMSTAVGLVKDKPVKLLKVIPEDLPSVRADPTRIRQVIINFLSNAAKFTEEGSITVEAQLQNSPTGKPEVIVKVSDTGLGIALEDQKRLFQPFSQVDESATRKTGGTGLGLSISRLLIELHGGRIGVISDTGMGSTFYFTLPLPVLEPVVNPDPSGRIILAIDDERPILSLYERYLSEHGYQVLPLSDPLKAVERAKEVKPFAITLDVMMPNRNGWQVIQDLKNDPETRDIPVIICSILEDQEKGFSLGAADYLMKPILEEDLVHALQRLNSDGSIHDVLVIDDDPDDLRLVDKILQKHNGFTVRLAQGGSEGLITLRSKTPDAVILDLFMPGLDGFTLLETMRADPSLIDIPVLIFTAGDLTEEQRHRLAEFSQDMLQKGVVGEEDFLASIEKALKHFNPPGGD